MAIPLREKFNESSLKTKILIKGRERGVREKHSLEECLHSHFRHSRQVSRNNAEREEKAGKKENGDGPSDEPTGKEVT